VQFCNEAKSCAYWLVKETLWYETETRPRHLIFSPRRDRDRDLPPFPRDRDETRPRRLETTSQDRLETETTFLPIAPPGPNVPSSWICGQNPQNDVDATFLDPHIPVVDCRCIARYDRQEVAGMANFKMYLLRQFCSNRAKFFLQHTGDTDAKYDGPEF